MKLSILICTTFNRREMFLALYGYLSEQAENKPVEILFHEDNKEISVGKKRQGLLEKAVGDYIVFVDSDDMVHPDYVDDILHAISYEPDCVGFKIRCEGMDGKPDKAIAKASVIYKNWADNVDGFDYVRSPYHKTPVKREIALKVGFPDKRYAEDYDYSMGLVGLLKTERFINKELYIYRYKYEKHETKYGIK